MATGIGERKRGIKSDERVSVHAMAQLRLTSTFFLCCCWTLFELYLTVAINQA